MRGGGLHIYFLVLLSEDGEGEGAGLLENITLRLSGFKIVFN